MAINRSLVTGLLEPLSDTLNIQDTITFLLDGFFPVWDWIRWPIIVLVLMDKPPVQRHLPAAAGGKGVAPPGTRFVTFNMSGGPGAARPPVEKPAEKSRNTEHGGDSILITSQTFQEARSRDASDSNV